MKLSPILFISAAFASTLAHTIQLPDLPDGSYLISIGEDGKPTWTEITANATDAPAPVVPKRGTNKISTRLRKRFIWPSGTFPYCPGGDWFLQDDLYSHGWDAFWNMCWEGGNRRYPAHTTITQYQGSSVTYMCAFTTNPCGTEEWVDAVNWVAGGCPGRSNGLMEPGFLDIPAWHKRYGYAKVGSSICG
ncbi:hypothetical protein B0H67DRAFT_499936 [Lasiosphaeris hirsuta]|uniref:Uncharacterized protein n=1 Tax=Lasiosphaeris hirsuta TaxID=260670 RepID=A0AA40DH09_9PEZI|nr:hypothetical protein B0H67DRAFT_499936 [Lasiosphaeris hirsuta]